MLGYALHAQFQRSQAAGQQRAMLNALLDELLANKSLLENPNVPAPRLEALSWRTLSQAGMLQRVQAEIRETLRQFYAEVLAYESSADAFRQHPTPPQEQCLRHLRGRLCGKVDEAIQAARQLLGEK